MTDKPNENVSCAFCANKDICILFQGIAIPMREYARVLASVQHNHQMRWANDTHLETRRALLVRFAQSCGHFRRER